MPEDLDILWEIMMAFDRRSTSDLMAWFLLNSSGTLAPHINQEALTRPGALLAFMRSRSLYHPSKFAPAELLHAPIQTWMDLDMLFEKMDGFVAVFNAEDDSPFVDFKAHEHARELVEQGLTMHPATAHWILFMQRIIYRMLVDCAEALLKLSAQNAEPRDAPSPPATTIYMDSTTAFDTAMEAPFQLTAQIPTDRLRCLVSAKINELEDHIWAMREDHGYFADTFEDVWQHDPITMRPDNAPMSPIIKHAPGFVNDTILRRAISEPHRTL